MEFTYRALSPDNNCFVFYKGLVMVINYSVRTIYGYYPMNSLVFAKSFPIF